MNLLVFCAAGAGGGSADGVLSPDGKPKLDAKDDGGPTSETHKAKVPSDAPPHDPPHPPPPPCVFVFFVASLCF